jgi:hypothetical protein
MAASYGQHYELNRKHLVGEWFASNDDSLFFKTDTLVLLKRTDNNVVLDRMCVSPDMAREQGLLNCMEFVNLRLRTRGRFEMWLYSGHSSEIWLTPMHWRFDEGVWIPFLCLIHWDFRLQKSKIHWISCCSRTLFETWIWNNQEFRTHLTFRVLNFCSQFMNLEIQF